MYRRRGTVVFAASGAVAVTHVLIVAAAGVTTVAVAGVPGQAIVVRGFVAAAETSNLGATVRCLSNATEVSPWLRTGGSATFQLAEALGSIRTVAGEDLVLDNPGTDNAHCLVSYELA